MLILSIDQASNAAGVTLWDHDTSTLLAHTLLKSASAKHGFGKRLVTMVDQLTTFLDQRMPADKKIDIVLFESVRARLVTSTVGAFCCSPHLVHCRISEAHTMVSSSTWKMYARKHGATEPQFKLIKGVKALKETGFPVDKYGISSEDVADSALIYLAWREKRQ